MEFCKKEKTQNYKSGKYEYQTSKRSKNTSLAEANHKVIIRWYLGTFLLVKLAPSTSFYWFRNLAQIEDMYHIWWTCLKIHKFFLKMYNLINYKAFIWSIIEQTHFKHFKNVSQNHWIMTKQQTNKHRIMSKQQTNNHVKRKRHYFQ